MTGNTEKKLTAAEIATRMTPTHLESVTTESLKEEVEKAMEAPSPEDQAKEPSKDPRARNPYTFQFSWADSRGKKWEGTFTTHYPTPLDLLRAGTMQSRLLGGAPKESLDALTDEIAFIVARLTFSLDDKPEWFKDPLSIVDGVPLLQAVYSEVLGFEQFFREHGSVAGSGGKKPGNA